MKKKLVIMLTGVFAASMLLAGCEASKGLETDDLKITQYKGVEVDEVEKPDEVTDEDVDASIQATLQTNATTTEVTDRLVQEGDTATIDFTGKIDGAEFEGGSSTDYPLVIGSGSFIEGFEDSIVGHNIGDTFDWNGKFPDDYSNADYAGKDVTFTITVKGIGVEEVPELTDDFVQTVSEESKTVDEYKEEVKKQLEDEAETTYNDTLRQEVWQTVLDNTEVKNYPEDEVTEMSDSLKSQYESAAEYYGTPVEDFIETQMGMTMDEFEEQVDTAVRSSIKETMITDAIAKEEKISPSDDEYNKQFEEMAESYGYEDVDALKEAAEEDDLKEIALNNLVKDWLVENCIQVAGE